MGTQSFNQTTCVWGVGIAAPGVEVLNAWGIPDTLTARMDPRLSLQTQEHWRPVSPCQVKGQINRMTVGMPPGCLTGVRGAR